MGKNKNQKGKPKKEKAFTIINTKKTKTKAVKTNLKKMNFQTKAKTDKADEKFKAIQESVYENGKTVKDKTALKANPKPEVKTQVIDMETTTETFARL